MMGTMSFHRPPVDRGTIAAVDALHPDIGVPIIHGNTPAKPMAASAVTLKSRGFFIYYVPLYALRNILSATSGDVNTPAKPMWTSVLTLKLRGFFVVCHPLQEVAP